MDKEKLLILYEDYLQKNENRSHVNSFDGERYRLVDSAYLTSNSVLKDEILPRYLTAGQLYKLDEKYNHTLTWRILESDVTDEQIAKFERENEIILPKLFREFVQGYSFLNTRFNPKCVASKEFCTEAYHEESDSYVPFTDEDWKKGELVGNVSVDFYGISNPNGLLHYKEKEFPPIKVVKYIDIGYVEGQWLSLDCETGEVTSWWHDGMAGEACSKEEYEEESDKGDFWFENFDDFLEWLFGRTEYIFEEDEEDDF